MNKFAQELLLLSYAHYSKTRDRHFDFRMKNMDDMYFYPEAAESLSDEGLIEPLSDNIFSDSINILAGTTLSFELTPQGIKYVERNLKTKA